MTSPSSLRANDLTAPESHTSPLSKKLSSRRSSASAVAVARSLGALAEAASRVNGLAASCPNDAISYDEAQARGAEVLDAIDDAMAAAVELSSSCEGSSALFAESADLLTDLVVICTWTLGRKRAALAAAVESRDAGRAVDACDSARRAVLRALGAIERAILPEGKSGGVALLLELETERSLRTRALYRAFRATVRPESTPSAGAIEARLTAVGVALATVFASATYRELRASDRRLFRELEARLSAFWSAPRTTATALAGVRLFQDIAAFAGCLRAVNQRAELVEHDARAAAALLPSIADDDFIEEGAMEVLGAVLGRDDELDEMLLGRRPARASELLPLLQSIAGRAGRA